MSDAAPPSGRLRTSLRSRPAHILLALVAAYAVCGFFLAPWLIRDQFPALVEKHLGGRGTVGEVRVNPFLFVIEATNVAITEKDGKPALSAARVLIDFETSSLLRWAWTFSRIELDRLTINAELDSKESLNLARLFASAQSAQPPAKPAARPTEPVLLPRLLLQHFAIAGGIFTFTDQTVQPTATASVDPVNFEMHEVSTLPNRQGEHVLNARLPGGGNLQWQGKITLSPIDSSGSIALKDAKLATLWQFVRDEVTFAEPAGTYNIGLRYRLRYGSGALDLQTEDMALVMKDLSLTQAKGSTALGTLALEGGRFDLRRRTLNFTNARIADGALNVVFDQNGTPDWAQLTRKPAMKPAVKAVPTTASAKSSPATPPWVINLPKVAIGPLALTVTDHSRTQPLQIDIGKIQSGFGLSAEIGATTQVVVGDLGMQISDARVRSGSAPDPLITLNQLDINGGAFDLRDRAVRIAALRLADGKTRITRDSNGAIDLASAFAARHEVPPGEKPFSIAIDKADLAGHAVTWSDRTFQPALSWDLEQLRFTISEIAVPFRKASPVELAIRAKPGGSLKATGNLDLSQPGANLKIELTDLALAPIETIVNQYTTLTLGTGKAGAVGQFEWNGKTSAVRYAGAMAVSDIDLKTVATGERQFAWQQLAAGNVRLDTGANTLSIAQVKLDRPYARIIINKDRSVNLSGIMRPRPVSSAPPAAITIERVGVERGTVDFADLSLVLPFATNIKSLSGAASGLSSAPDSRAALKFEGRVEEYGLARAEGTIQPFAPKKHTDIAVIFRNIDLLPLSPYTATFAGRRISSGKLSLDLQYKINNSQLTGENKVLLEQFTLGERVDSPSAVDLPLDLAVALLTDSEGRINLSVPVTGNVDSPDFSYGHLTWQAIRTVITSIVTAPFRALGALFGAGGGDADALGDIVFDPGSARILPTEYDKVRRVAEGLQKRQQLKLLVQGLYHQDRDGRALRERAVRADLATREGLQLAPNEDPGPVGYDSPKTQRAMENMLNESAGGDAAAQFAAAFRKEAGREVSRVNPVLAVVGRGAGDHALYQAMYQRLVELRELPANALTDLARARAEALNGALVKRFKLDPARVGSKPLAAAAELPANGVPAKLSFETLK